MILRQVQHTHELGVDAAELWETTAFGNGETRRKTCQNGWRSLLTIQWTEKLPHHVKHTHAGLVSRFIQIQKWYQDSVASLRTCRKTEIAKYAKRCGNQARRAEKMVT